MCQEQIELIDELTAVADEKDARALAQLEVLARHCQGVLAALARLQTLLVGMDRYGDEAA